MAQVKPPHPRPASNLRAKVPNDAIYLPKYSPMLAIYDEPGKRKARCRGCNEDVLKGEPRKVLHLFYWGAGVRKFNNGGIATSGRFFFHPACFVMDEEVRNACTQCGTELTTFRHRPEVGSQVRLTWKTVENIGRVCAPCLEDPRFQPCVNCARVFETFRLSPIVETNSYHGLCCDACAVGYGLTTVKSQNRRDKADKVFDNMYLSILTRIKDNGVFG